MASAACGSRVDVVLGVLVVVVCFGVALGSSEEHPTTTRRMPVAAAKATVARLRGARYEERRTFHME